MQKNNAADRMRPILEAMEQSVNAARRKRLGEPEPDASPAEAVNGHSPNGSLTSRPSPIPHSSSNGHAPLSNDRASDRISGGGGGGWSSAIREEPAPASTQPARLKAKPKRPSGFGVDEQVDNTWHSQAG